jgi:hypothetical protein
MTVGEYLQSLQRTLKTGLSTEHSFRGDLKALLETVLPGVTVTNEPKRQLCGAPDYIIQNGEVPIGYLEAKDLGSILDEYEETDQLVRYRDALDNLVLTNYLEFRFFRRGLKTNTLILGTIQKNGAIEGHFESGSFSQDICDFFQQPCQSITSAEQLAQMMARKARMMEEVLYHVTINPDDDPSLQEQFQAFRKLLLHDLTERGFADIYAQTITYGMFAARLNDATADTFSRSEALFLVPKTNPFLMQLFSYVAGPNLDDRISWIVSDLADIFRATNVSLILSDFGTKTQQTDPFIHFYETFLTEYDPQLRVQRGVFYTPKPIARFIVRAIDQSLQSEFGLSEGLADREKVTFSHKGEKDNEIDEEVYRVQILDPAAGTGTFLAEVIEQIYQKYPGQEGIWNSLVRDVLIPRIHGFEILMAPYVIAHLKLDMLLKGLGFQATAKDHLGVFLTNSLEPADPITEHLFGAEWLAKEAREANVIKRDFPIMVVLGNPPYSNFGQSNRGKWIEELIAVYKEGVDEKKINLDDDYIKFLRFSENLIERNERGIVGMITNNSFLEGLTHRQMRLHLLKTFDLIHIVNLHGDVKKKEQALDGSADENVFDIQQGVCIVIMVKSSPHSAKLSDIYYADIYGSRVEKYHLLWQKDLNELDFTALKPEAPEYYFVPFDLSLKDEYEQGFQLSKVFHTYSSGIQTKKDGFLVSRDHAELAKRLQDLQSLPAEQVRTTYNLGKDTSGWSVERAKIDAMTNSPSIIEIQYRPLDFRFCMYTARSGGLLGRPRAEVSSQFLQAKNVGLIFNRKVANQKFTHVGISRVPICHGTFYLGNVGQDYLAPAFRLNDHRELGRIDETISNLEPDFVGSFEAMTGLSHDDRITSEATFSTLQIIDYVLALLSSPKYREKYAGLLKRDFPWVPYPQSAEKFRTICKLGERLRNLFAYQSVPSNVVKFPIKGTNSVDKVSFLGKRVNINEEQYFENVAADAWDYEIGGYQPLQKFLIDRESTRLSIDEILHYEKTVAIIVEIIKVTAQIDEQICN